MLEEDGWEGIGKPVSRACIKKTQQVQEKKKLTLIHPAFKASLWLLFWSNVKLIILQTFASYTLICLLLLKNKFDKYFTI